MKSYGYEGTHRVTKPANVEWCRNLFDSLNDGGHWGVPNTGLVYTKRGDKLVLTERMVLSPEHGTTGAKLAKWQQEQYEQTVRHFGAAGVTVTDETKIEKNC